MSLRFYLLYSLVCINLLISSFPLLTAVSKNLHQKLYVSITPTIHINRNNALILLYNFFFPFKQHSKNKSGPGVKYKGDKGEYDVTSLAVQLSTPTCRFLLILLVSLYKTAYSTMSPETKSTITPPIILQSIL